MAFSLLLSCLALAAQAKDRAVKVEKIELVSLSVSRVPATDVLPYRNRFGAGPGLSVEFNMTVPDCRVLDLAPDPLRVESYKDDQGHELALGVGITLARGMDLRRYPSREEPGSENTLTATLRAGKAPPKGALKFRFKGEASLLCAAGKTRTLSKELPLEAGASASDGQLELKVASAERMQGVRESGGLSWATLILKPSLPLQQLASVRLTGPDGEVLAHWVNQRSRDSEGGQAGEITLRVRSGAPKAELETQYFEKVETVTVPLELESGLGL